MRLGDPRGSSVELISFVRRLYQTVEDRVKNGESACGSRQWTSRLLGSWSAGKKKQSCQVKHMVSNGIRNSRRSGQREKRANLRCGSPAYLRSGRLRCFPLRVEALFTLLRVTQDPSQLGFTSEPGGRCFVLSRRGTHRAEAVGLTSQTLQGDS